MLPMSELTERMIESIVDDGWIDPDRITAVVARAMETAERDGREAIMPVDLADAINEEIEREANSRVLAD